MTAHEVLEFLKSKANASRKRSYQKYGDNYTGFGVMTGELRILAKQHKGDQALALELWCTGNTDAQLVASMILDPKQLTREQAEKLVEQTTYIQVIDELVFKTLRHTDYAADLERQWISSTEPLVGRCGWGLATTRVIDKTASIDQMDAYLAVVDADLVDSEPLTQWAMNRTLCEIGIRYPDYTDRCLEIGQRLGVYKDEKVAKGCVGAYAPAWIEAGLRSRKR